jgi:hypothetical protein
MLKRLLQRGLYYIQTGSALGGLPLSLLNFATIFYYNVVVSVAWLSGIFSGFQYFLLAAIIAIPMFFGLLGYFYKKRSGFYMGQVEIDVEANKYQTDKLTPVALPCWEMLCEVADKLGVESKETKELLANSGSKKYVKFKTC